MTRQEAYIAELSQLLFYMTPWDKAEALKEISAKINHPETGVQTMEEMGTPMKMAVTLHRQYEPTPEPTPEELAAKAAAEKAAEEVEAAEQTVATEEVEAVEEAEAIEEVEAVEEAEATEEVEATEAADSDNAAEVSVDEEAVNEAPAAEEGEEEAVPAEEAPLQEPEAETAAVEEAAVQEVPVEEPEQKTEEQESLQYVERLGQEKIFAEIFNAATSAQSAVPPQEEPETKTVRKARYWFLIPYIALAVVIGVPATLVFAVANVGVLAATLVGLCGVLYLVIFQLLSAAVLSSKLIIIGLTLLMLCITIMLGVMTVWFLRTATIGFPQFLIEVAKQYGYREVEVQ